MRGLFLLFLFYTSSAFAQSPLCEEGKAALTATQKFISCDAVDFKKKAISADFQSKQTAPLVAPPSQIKDAATGEQIYKNEYPGILNTKAFFDADATLMNKFYQYEQVQSAQSPNPLSNAYRDSMNFLPTLFDELKSSSTQSGDSKITAKSWEGKCELWSSWSLDPSISEALGRMRDGILCSNIPFTKGELKELITAFYPLPNFIDREHLQNFYDPRPANYDPSKNQSMSEDIKREDANIALTKLGELGGGSRFTPASVMQMAKTALQNGQNMIFGIDPGNEVWNQPMEEIVDIVYQDAAAQSSVGYQAQDFDSANDPKNVVGQIRTLEADLKSASAQGRVDYSFSTGTTNLGTEFCRLKRALSEDCNDMLKADGVTWKDAPPLSQQIDQLWTLENTAMNQGVITNHAPPVEHHKILIRYGVEGKFAQTAQQKSKIRTLEYSKVGDRSAWAPPVKTLAQACGSEGTGDRNEGHNSLISDLKDECSLFLAGKTPNREVFTGALPPNEFKTFIAKAQFGADPESQNKKRAYEQLLDMTKQCPVFDDGATFLTDLKNTLASNQVAQSDLDRLSGEYQKAGRLLNQNFVKSSIQDALKAANSSPAAVSGLSALYQRIFP